MPSRPRPVADLVAAALFALGGEQAVLGVDDQVPAAASVEAEDELAVALAERVLELVAVAPLLDRRLDLLQLESLEAAEPAQRVLDLGLLVAQLLLVGEAPARARPGTARRRGRSASACRSATRLEQLDGRGLGEVALRLRHLGPDAVAREAAGDEHDIAVAAGEPAAAVGEALDVELEQLAAGAGARRRVGCVPGCSFIRAYRCSPLALRPRLLRGADAERFLERDRPRVLPALRRATSPTSRSSRSTSATRRCSSATRSSACVSGATRREGERRRRACATCSSSRWTAYGPSTRSGGRGSPSARRSSRSRSTARRSLPAGAGRAGQRAGPGAPRRRSRRARLALLDERLNPLHLEALERTHASCRRARLAQLPRCYADARGIDLRRWRGRPSASSRRPSGVYRARRRAAAASGSSGFGSTAAAVRPAALLPRARTGRAVPGRAADPGVRRDDRRARHRPRTRSRTSSSTPSSARRRARAPSARRCGCPEEVYLVIRRSAAGRTSRRSSTRAGHAEHYANVDAGAAVRVPLPRRQLGDRVVRLPARAPDREPGVAHASVLGVDGRRGRRSTTRAPSRLVFLRRYAAKLAYELELHGGERRPGGDAGALRELLGERSASRGRARPGSPTSTRASTSPATCAPGRSRRTGARPWRSASAALVRRRRGGRLAARAVGAGPARSMRDRLLARWAGGRLYFGRLATELS